MRLGLWIMDGLTPRHHHRRVVCRETARIRDNGTGRKSYSLNKTEPLVTRNAIEIVSSKLPCIVRSHESRATIDIALILVQSPVIRSKDLKGSSCHGNWWTNVRLRDTAYWLPEHPQSALRLLHNKEKYVLLHCKYELSFRNLYAEQIQVFPTNVTNKW